MSCLPHFYFFHDKLQPFPPKKTDLVHPSSSYSRIVMAIWGKKKKKKKICNSGTWLKKPLGIWHRQSVCVIVYGREWVKEALDRDLTLKTLFLLALNSVYVNCLSYWPRCAIWRVGPLSLFPSCSTLLPRPRTHLCQMITLKGSPCLLSRTS